MAQRIVVSTAFLRKRKFRKKRPKASKNEDLVHPRKGRESVRGKRDDSLRHLLSLSSTFKRLGMRGARGRPAYHGFWDLTYCSQRKGREENKSRNNKKVLEIERDITPAQLVDPQHAGATPRSRKVRFAEKKRRSFALREIASLLRREAPIGGGDLCRDRMKGNRSSGESF